MPFIVKATYRNETRKFTFTEPYFPSFQALYHQLYRVFAVGHSYYLSKLLFSPQEGMRILIGIEAHSAAEYDAQVAHFKGHSYPNGRLIFSVFDETPHKLPATSSRVLASAPNTSIHPIPPVPPIPFFAPPPPPTYQPQVSSPPNMNLLPPIPRFQMDVSGDSQLTPKNSTKPIQTECCSVAEGKKEVKSMMDKFVRDFTRVMATTFGEDFSFFDPLASPPQHGAPPNASNSAIDLEASLTIPGSFIQPRPRSPITVDDEVENSQCPPHLEPSQMLHPNIWCDFCGKQIRGLRFKCQECTDYDLCANCIVVNQALDKHNANQPRIHGFSTISPPQPKDPGTRAPVIPIIPQLSPLAISPSAPEPVVPPLNITPPSVTESVVPPQLDIPQSTPEPVVHRGITCDMCQKTVVGNRHKCLDCPDYDLCDTCIKDAPVQHPLHQFLKIDTPGRVIVHTVVTPPERPPSPAIHNARCNLCDSRIVGERYKCTNCPDFDTCAACFVITPEQHPKHIFIRVTKPTDVIIPQRFIQEYHPAICDGCNENITGVRYKCMHAECPDFDLCQDCEALPIAVHPATHPLLKIKTATTHIPTIQRRTSSSAEQATPTSAPSAPARNVSLKESASTSASVAPSSTIVSTSVERLHEIRMQAERRLSARMQQLQKLSSADSGSPAPHPVGPVVDPAFEERLLKERKETGEKTLSTDTDCELEVVGTAKQDEEAPMRACGTPPSDSTSNSRTETHHDPKAPENVSSEGSSTEVVTPKHISPVRQTTPEMTQKTSGLFGSPFILLESSLQATFISDNNIPDGHIFATGSEFVKSWRVENSGSEAWGKGTELVFVGGIRLGVFEDAPKLYEVGVVGPGEIVDVCAGDMKAPDISGRFTSYWRLRDPQGRQFGPKMWCDIQVLETESDHSQHHSLVNSAVVMPETAPVASTLPSTPSSPITVPSSAITLSEDDTSSVGSVSLVDHNDSDWDDVPDAPLPPLSPASSRALQAPRNAVDAEYLVLYDSSDSASDEA